MRPIRRVLVIKLSALGDVVLAIPAFERIRAAHPDAAITLLTTAPFEGLARASPFFDDVKTDGRPRSLSGAFALIRCLRAARFDRVYDLQTNDRTNLCFQALRPFPPAWSGTAWGCALPHDSRRRSAMHTLERQADQLASAGIWPDAPTAPFTALPPDVTWLTAGALPVLRSELPMALMIPGAAPHRPAKRWPANRYGELAQSLAAEGFDVAVIGGEAERGLARQILGAAPEARDLTGRTTLAEIAVLGAAAALGVGNDTGPAHLIAAAGAPLVSLFSGASDPSLCAPRGRVTVLRRDDLADLPVAEVLAASLARADMSRGRSPAP